MVPIPWVPNLQVQGHLPTSKTCMRIPEDGTPCDRERFLKSTSFLISFARVRHYSAITMILLLVIKIATSFSALSHMDPPDILKITLFAQKLCLRKEGVALPSGLYIMYRIPSVSSL